MSLHKNRLFISFSTRIISLMSLLGCDVSETRTSYSSSTSNIWGIDISHHQGHINWKHIENRPPHFIFMKATEGATHKDSRYKSYRKEAQKLGISTGAYHFFSYTSDGEQQARHFLKYANLRKDDLLPVLDCEYQKKMPQKTKVTNELVKFIRAVEKDLGVKPIIYCEEGYYKRYLKQDLGNRYPLWICDFRKQPQCEFTFWQKTDRFRHPAFRGTIDYNQFYGNLAELSKYTIK